MTLVSNTGGWSNVGGAASIPVALSDASDTAYAESPTSTGVAAPFVVDPSGVMSGPASGKVRIRSKLSASGTGDPSAKLYDGPGGSNTIRKSWTAADFALTTSLGWTELDFTSVIGTVVDWPGGAPLEVIWT